MTIPATCTHSRSGTEVSGRTLRHHHTRMLAVCKVMQCRSDICLSEPCRSAEAPHDQGGCGCSSSVQTGATSQPHTWLHERRILLLSGATRDFYRTPLL